MAIVFLGLLIFCIVLVSINYLHRDRKGNGLKQDSKSMAMLGKDSGSKDIKSGRDNRGMDAVSYSHRSSSRSSSPHNNSVRAGSSRTSSPTRTTAAKKYAAVGVRPRLDSCRAVLALENIRFLAEEAPHFPVPGCNAESCRCQYVYYSDRRDEERRTSFGVARNWIPTGGGDRRREDRRRNTV